MFIRKKLLMFWNSYISGIDQTYQEIKNIRIYVSSSNNTSNRARNMFSCNSIHKSDERNYIFPGNWFVGSIRLPFLFEMRFCNVRIHVGCIFHCSCTFSHQSIWSWSIESSSLWLHWRSMINFHYVPDIPDAGNGLEISNKLWSKVSSKCFIA